MKARRDGARGRHFGGKISGELSTVVLTEEEITGPEYISALSETLLHGEYVTVVSTIGALESGKLTSAGNSMLMLSGAA